MSIRFSLGKFNKGSDVKHIIIAFERYIKNIMHFDWYILGTIISGLSSAFFGCLVFFYNRNKTGLISSCSVSLSRCGRLPYAVWLSQPDAIDALFWSRVLNLGAVLIPIFYIHWIVSNLNVESKHKKLLLHQCRRNRSLCRISFLLLYL